MTTEEIKTEKIDIKSMIDDLDTETLHDVAEFETDPIGTEVW